MRLNDFKEIKVLDEKSLIEKVKVLRGEFADLVLDKNIGKLKDVKAISKKKKDLAQVLTTLRQKQMLRELEESKPVEPVESVEPVKTEKAEKKGNKK